jgi:diguanylate cyclase (GGDEF)-like protein
MKAPSSLQKIIYRQYLKSALVPMLVIEILLLSLYFGINLYTSGKNQALLLEEVQGNLLDLTSVRATRIDTQLRGVARLASIMQADHERFFASDRYCVLPNGEPQFARHANGAYYKQADNGGSSLYYSATTRIGEIEARKARCSEGIDPLMRSIVETNPLVTQAYINTWDGMNRIYPFLRDADQRFGPSWNVEELNFYYEADAQHNPERRGVWTSAYLDPAGQGWVMSHVVPIYRGDQLEAVSGLDITIDGIVDHILDLQLAWDAAAFMVDRKGTILAMPPRIEALMGLQEIRDHDYAEPIVATWEKPDEYNLLTGRHPVFRDRLADFFQSGDNVAELSVDGHEYSLIQQVVPQTGWRLMVLVDKAAIFEPIEAMRALSNRIGYLAIGGMLLFYLVFFVVLLSVARRLASRIATPIHALSEATGHLGRGLREKPLQAVGIQEIDALSVNFNAMADELEQRSSQLAESRVRERMTQEEARTLQRIASTDALTGAHNRRKIQDLLQAERLNFERSGRPFGIILGDIDHFKDVNDRHGHLVGDRVLAEIAGVLAASLRESDTLGRWGGEEFIILCPGASLHGLTTLAKALCRRVEKHMFPMVGQKTISFGVTLARSGDTVESVIARADRALYAAKAGGRNRVEVSD